MTIGSPSFVVGIGASAGGLSPIEELFDNMPFDTGMAFVIVQHLSPDFKSLMDELLARHTKMSIHQVSDGILVEPNSIYLIPPEKNMALANGKLLLTQQEHARGLNLPIDIFFRSLAKDAGERAIAIVLSGTGSDGSRGIRDVHEAGGIVLVQDVESAAFDGMPRAAMQTGVTDAACTPQEMSQRIVAYSKSSKSADDRSILANEEVAADLPSESSMFRILRLFRLRQGLDFTLYKPATITRRLERRMQLGGFTDPQVYADHLEADDDEADALFRDLLVEVTQFFRDPAAFELLRKSVIPGIVERSDPDQELRVWVPGCATGEEAYSIAILLMDAIEQAGRIQDFKVFATDVHRNSLETASTAVYPLSSMDSVPRDFQVKYFTKSNGLCHVRREVRSKVILAANDLTKDPPFTRLDLISCRNVLIYLEPEVQRRVLSLFHFGLKTGGVLFLGPSETVGDLATEFDAVDRHWRIYSKRRDVRLGDAARVPMAPVLANVVREPTQVIFTGIKQDQNSWAATAWEDLLAKYVPPSLLINESNELLHTFGDARKVLIQPEGRPTLDVFKLLPNPLRSAASAALHQAKVEESPVVLKGVRFGEEGDTQLFNVKVEPYKRSGRDLFLICLEPSEERIDPVQVIEHFDSENTSSEHIKQLERELTYTRETLQATVEELESSNEELQATNEELIASNEELQSTNEELHSVNEELYTVNSEHKQKIEELTQLTSDMDNLLRSTDIGTIFLDHEFRIRMFTPAISSAFNVLPQDVGRPIDHIAYKLDSPNLLADASDVLTSQRPREVEVQSGDGKVYLQRMQPYRTENGDVEGIVLTTTDVTELKQAEQAQRTMMTLAQINEELPDFAYAVSHDLQAPLRHISQYSEMLQAAVKDEDSHKIVKSTKVISDSASSLREMIDALLAYSRINTRGRPMDRVPLMEVVADAVASLSASIEFHEAEIHFDDLPVVSGDRQQLCTLFFHLLDNAIKYRAEEAPHIQIVSEREEGYVHLSVADNGIGVDHRNYNRVFTIFKRLGFKPDVPGVGVGLALSKRIVLRHGGRIWLEANPAGGLVVCMTLREFVERPVETQPAGIEL